MLNSVKVPTVESPSVLPSRHAFDSYDFEVTAWRVRSTEENKKTIEIGKDWGKRINSNSNCSSNSKWPDDGFLCSLIIETLVLLSI